MKAPVPTLSLLGWLRNPRESLDLLITHFFLTNASQTIVYRGKITTAQEILQKYATDAEIAASEMSSALNQVLRKYFDDSSISITTKLRDPTVSASVVEFVLSGIVVDENVSYQLNKVVETRNGTFIKFVEINNG